MRTAQEVIEWIKANVPEDPNDNRTAHEKVVWWVAYRTAEQMRDVNDLKDWAELLTVGFKPIETVEDIQSWLDDNYYQHDEDYLSPESDLGEHDLEKLDNNAAAELEYDLRVFWGLS